MFHNILLLTRVPAEEHDPVGLPISEQQARERGTVPAVFMRDSIIVLSD